MLLWEFERIFSVDFFIVGGFSFTRCTCDDCSLSHILTCGIMDSPISEDLHIKLPSKGESPRNYLAEVHPPSLSSESSASGSNSSSPITIQQHPRLILPEGDVSTL